jgi:adenylate cyclase
MGEERKVRPPIELCVGRLRVVLGRFPEKGEEQLHSLAHSSKAPGQLAAVDAIASLSLSPGSGVEVQPFIAWLRVALEVLQSAAGAPDFLKRAAEATANLVKLDSAGVLMRDGQKYSTAALARLSLGDSRDWCPSRNMLNMVCHERKTCWRGQHDLGSHPGSLEGVTSVVAAPILDPSGHVIGVLYGDRRRYDQPALGELEARLVELLASGIAAGLARQEQQETHIRLQQFFPSNLVNLIENNSDLLNGRNAVVTVMVADIFGFSTLAERLGPSETVQWIRAVMNLLSDCVIEQEGVLVDYVGDELMAMWGAPIAQADDPRRACRAVLQARKLLVDLSKRWEAVLGQPTVIGFGVNTGPAYVGNVGSLRKFKYGPLGNTVNVASRAQGASKYLRSFSLITGEVQCRLDASFATRRLCQAQMKNIAEPVTLYELADDPSPVWRELKDTYEEALRCFEAADFHRAAKLLGVALEKSAADGPSMELLRRAVNAMNQRGEKFDPVWRFADK